jgi:hypothetical protein
VGRHCLTTALLLALAFVISGCMADQSAVRRPPDTAPLHERVAFYVNRLGDRRYVEHREHDGDTTIWYVAAEELGQIGVAAIPPLIERLQASTDTYERQQIFYALRLAVQNMNAASSVGTGYLMQPEAFPSEDAHPTLKRHWLEWWSLHEQAIKAAAGNAEDTSR